MIFIELTTRLCCGVCSLFRTVKQTSLNELNWTHSSVFLFIRAYLILTIVNHLPFSFTIRSMQFALLDLFQIWDFVGLGFFISLSHFTISFYPGTDWYYYSLLTSFGTLDLTKVNMFWIDIMNIHWINYRFSYLPICSDALRCPSVSK